MRRVLTHAGRTMTLSAWARELDVPYALLYTRLVQQGWPVERVLTEPRAPTWSADPLLPPRKARLISFNGREMSLSAWAREIGVTPEVLRNRIDALGWTIEQALTTPSRRSA